MPPLERRVVLTQKGDYVIKSMKELRRLKILEAEDFVV